MPQNEKWSAKTNQMNVKYLTFCHQQSIFLMVTQQYRVKGGWKGGN